MNNKNDNLDGAQETKNTNTDSNETTNDEISSYIAELEQVPEEELTNEQRIILMKHSEAQKLGEKVKANSYIADRHKAKKKEEDEERSSLEKQVQELKQKTEERELQDKKTLLLSELARVKEDSSFGGHVNDDVVIAQVLESGKTVEEVFNSIYQPVTTGSENTVEEEQAVTFSEEELSRFQSLKADDMNKFISENPEKAAQLLKAIQASRGGF